MLILPLFFGLLHPSAPAPAASPPFARQWTVRTGDDVYVIAGRGPVIYYRSNKGLGAIDVATGRLLWNSLPAKRIGAAVLLGGTLYALTEEEKKSALVAVDAATGKSRPLARLQTRAWHMAADSSRLFVADDEGALHAFDPRNGTKVWTHRLVTGKRRGVMLVQLEATQKGVFAGLDDAGEFGVDPQTGAVRWTRPLKYAGLYPPIVAEGDVISRSDGLARIDIRTGKVLWKASQASTADLVGDVIVTAVDAEKILLDRDVKTGKIVWKIPVAVEQRVLGMEHPHTVSDGEFVWLQSEPAICLSKTGAVAWQAMQPVTGTPVYVYGDTLVTAEIIRLMGYRRGSLPELPSGEAERRGHAARLASQLELLDNAERKQLEALAPYTFQPLLARYVEWAKAYDANPEGKEGYPLYHMMTDLNGLLLATARAEDTPAIVHALSDLNRRSSWRGTLEGILQEKGNPADFVPVLVRQLRATPTKKGEEGEGGGDYPALSAVSHASHPEAVAFMLEALRNPKAPSAWRKEAFVHLAGTDEAEGAAAVRAARPKAGPREPWYRLVDPGQLQKYQIVDTRTDAKGRIWRLFHSRVLGNEGDVFIAQKRGSGWDRPLFTGAWSGRTFNAEAPKTFRGVPLAKLVSTEWIRLFPDDASLRADADGDGLTDLVEARLGMDPKKADTDGDGLSDAVDPCPNAAPRPLGDTEKVIAACLDARFFEQGWSTPAILSVTGVKPFELYGYPRPLLWQTSESRSPLSDCYGAGVNIIRFEAPREGRRSAAVIEFDSDGKTARTVISRYSGGLDGDGILLTLKKVGDEWFVVDERMMYVS